MRELAKTVPVAPDVLYYAMRLVARTHPELGDSGETAKKYVKYGCSPRAGQALITAAVISVPAVASALNQVKRTAVS